MYENNKDWSPIKKGIKGIQYNMNNCGAEAMKTLEGKSHGHILRKTVSF